MIFLKSRHLTPQQTVQIPVFLDNGCGDDPPVAQLDTLGQQASTLLAEARRARRERDAAIGTQDAMPGQFRMTALGKKARHQPRAARNAGATGHRPIAADTPRRNRRDGRFNGLAILVDQSHAFTRSAVPAP